MSKFGIPNMRFIKIRNSILNTRFAIGDRQELFKNKLYIIDKKQDFTGTPAQLHMHIDKNNTVYIIYDSLSESLFANSVEIFGSTTGHYAFII